MQHYDVAVVGAGPAGSTTARELAETGIRTVVLERARLPRYKSCAGGIPLRTAALLPFSIEPVVEDAIAGINVSYRGRGGFDQIAEAPFAAMVMRDRFDALLATAAADAGAELIDQVTVRSIERDNSLFVVRTDREAFTARLLVGADGANSMVARASGLGVGLLEACALEAELRAPAAALARWRGLVNVDLGYRPAGYGWVFPKERLLSVGLVLPSVFASRLRAELEAYLSRLGLGGARFERLVGHKVLFRRAREPIAGSGVLLVGDAAGLVDEFTEEGIYYAIRSGQLAAQTLHAALEQGHSRLGSYERAIDREVMPELRAARVIARLFYGSLTRAPRTMFYLSKQVRYLWRAFFRVQRGESSYLEEVRRTRVVLPLARLPLR